MILPLPQLFGGFKAQSALDGGGFIPSSRAVVGNHPDFSPWPPYVSSPRKRKKLKRLKK